MENNYVINHRGTIALVGKDINRIGLARYIELITLLNTKARGKALSIDVDELNENRRKRDGDGYHMTLISKNEIAQAQEFLAIDGIKVSLLEFVSEYINESTVYAHNWFSFGVGEIYGNTAQAYFDICLYPRALALRRRLGLSTKYGFHITIGFINADVHKRYKSFQHLMNMDSLQNSSTHHTIPELLQAAKYLLQHEIDKNDKSRDGLNDEGIKGLLNVADLIYNAQNHHVEEIKSTITANDEKLIEIALMKIRLKNKVGDYHDLLFIADKILSIPKFQHIDILKVPNIYKLITIISSFKGAALVRLGNFLNAIQTLELSYKMENILLNYFEEKEDATNANAKKQCKKRVERLRVLMKKCKQNLGGKLFTPKLYKFPRTRHIGDAAENVVDWGKKTTNNNGSNKQSAVTRDDLLLDQSEIATLCDGKTEIRLQEKIDGANLGISIGHNGQIYCQNRSKYISSQDSPQYGLLDQWLRVHGTILHMLLEPGRHILFGEWVVARHSIPYLKLPGYFIAFDLYDSVMEKFCSVKEFHRQLKEVSTKLSLPQSPLPVVPTIVTRTFNKPDEMLPYLETKSQFRNDNSTVEGIYLRVDKAKWLNKRCKLVRPDFIHGIKEGHWMKRKMEKNKIDFNFSIQYLTNCLEVMEENDGDDRDKDNNIGKKEVFNNNNCNNKNNKGSNDKLFNTRQRLQLKINENETIRMMRNFSYVIPNELAGASTPNCQKHIDGLEQLGITLVITLTEEEPLVEDWFKKKRKIRNVFFPVPNYNPPSIEQMEAIDSVVRKEILRGGQVLVHCGGGKGRAGSVISCLLIKYGLNGIKNQILKEARTDEIDGAFFSSEQVMKIVRDMRPGSVETTRQEQFIRDYTKYVWKLFYYSHSNAKASNNNNNNNNNACIAPPNLKRQLSDNGSNSEESFQSASDLVDTLVSNPASIKRMEKKKKKQRNSEKKAMKHAQSKVPKFLILCGFPGSGKSTFAKEMVLNGSGKFVRCNQDELGKKACMNLLSKHANGNKRNIRKHVIVDRCNITVADRKALMELMFNPAPKDIACVYFDVSAEECCERIAKRQDHPTIKPGTPASKMKIVGSFRKRLEVPDLAEGFSHVYHLQTFEDADNLLMKFGCKIKKRE